MHTQREQEEIVLKTRAGLVRFGLVRFAAIFQGAKR